MHATASLLWNVLVSTTYLDDLARMLKASSPQVVIEEFNSRLCLRARHHLIFHSPPT